MTTWRCTPHDLAEEVDVLDSQAEDLPLAQAQTRREGQQECVPLGQRTPEADHLGVCPGHDAPLVQLGQADGTCAARVLRDPLVVHGGAEHCRQGGDEYPHRPNRAGVLLKSLSTGRVTPGYCGTLTCPVCVRVQAFSFGRAIGLAQPERMLLLTQGSYEWRENRRRLNRFRDILRMKGQAEYQDAVHVEPNPGGGGTHLHLAHWGDEPTTRQLREAASRAGFGRYAGAEVLRAAPGKPLTYGMKIVVGGSPLGPDLPSATREFLALNGGRLGHATRGFWRDGPGRPLRGREAAWQVLRARRVDRGPWIATVDTSGTAG